MLIAWTLVDKGMPLGDTGEFHSPYLHQVYGRERAVGEVGDGGPGRSAGWT